MEELQAVIIKEIRNHIAGMTSDIPNWGAADLESQIRKMGYVRSLTTRLMESDDFSVGSSKIGKAMVEVMVAAIDWEAVKAAVAADIAEFKRLARAEIKRQDTEDELAA